MKLTQFNLLISLILLFISLPLHAEVDTLDTIGKYIKKQKFRLQHQQEYVISSKNSDEGYLQEMPYGETRQVISGMAKGNVEGYLKWIKSDPNGYELDVEFGPSDYTWKDTYDPVPDWQQAERKGCWLAPFTAHVTMQKDRDIPLHIKITKTDCPQDQAEIPYERVLHLLDDLLLTALDKDFILSYNYPNKKLGPQIFNLEYADQVLFEGIGPKPFDYNSGRYYRHPPKQLRYHFKIENAKVAGLVLSDLSYLGGGLSSYEYDYDPEKQEAAHASQLFFVPLKSMEDSTCNDVVEMLNSEKPAGNRLFREVWIKDVKN